MSHVDWPELNDYFRFYGLEPVYDIDIQELKKLYLGKSRQFHPDFFGENQKDQVRAIEVTAYNNKAFRVLNSPAGRIRYLIMLNEKEEEEQSRLPQEFLMEMLELNEQIDEFESASDKADLKGKIESEINAALLRLNELLIGLIRDKQWTPAKNELLKVNYLERLLGRLTL